MSAASMSRQTLRAYSVLYLIILWKAVLRTQRVIMHVKQRRYQALCTFSSTFFFYVHSCWRNKTRSEFSLGLAWIGGACLSETVASLIKLLKTDRTLLASLLASLLSSLLAILLASFCSSVWGIEIFASERWKWTGSVSSCGTPSTVPKLH